ncbi:pA528R [African swine fever virus]|uniref:Protein MGF 505-7R n=1 Tax=African swine fever virus (strain Badajoz 1971 Vero-adapted) TaxID=10498 RepID=5057R_ASFB7|nr:pA528R [African swine fever virus]Q89925.1 RecName: Full=Protein MGF 505-7R [African swine fever virus BA71V]AAA17789.1 A528R protein [African swine fever virus]AAA65260.1 pA528R [African swine fever virus]prf//2113434AC A528R gene [African swine fever virus]
MFSLQDLCRKNTFFLPNDFSKHTLQRLGLYWKEHGSVHRIEKDSIMIQNELVLSINDALQLAGEEGDTDVVQLLLLWEGNLHYAIIGALKTENYNLVCEYHSQIQDWHILLPLIQDPETFEKCHDLSLGCDLICLLQHAVKCDMLSILVKYKEDLLNVRIRHRTQSLFVLACENRRFEIIEWIGQNLSIPEPEAIFSIAIVTKDVELFSLGYKIIFDYMQRQGIFQLTNVVRMLLLNRHIGMAIEKGLLPFILETLKYGGSVKRALSYAVIDNKRKIIDYLVRHENIPRGTIERLLHLAVKKQSSRKTLNLLLSYINYKVKNVKKLLEHVVKYNSTLVIRILLEKKKNLLDATLTRYVKDSTYFQVKEFMQDFSISPEKFIKIAVREKRNVLIKGISEDIWENPAERIRNLKQIVCTIKYESGRQFLINIIHTIYQSYSLKPEEILKLATFYVKHNATTHFKDLCKYLWLNRGTESKKLFLECLEIADEKEFPDIKSIVSEYINYLFTAGAITKEEIMQVYALEYAMY